ncbi:MAG: ABC transporter ATP-binding protein [bacterium]|nr:ABC transporter ATP-binding protein [bacterium]
MNFVQNNTMQDKQSKNKKRKYKERGIFQELLQKNMPYLIAEIFLSFVVTQILVMGNTKLSGAIDRMLAGEVHNLYNGTFLRYLAVLTILGFVCSYGRQKCAALFSIRIQTEFRARAVRKLMRISYPYFVEKNSSSVMNKMVSDIGVVASYYSETLPALVVVFVTSAAVLYSIGRLDVSLVVFFLVLFPVILIVSYYVNKRIGKLVEKHWELTDMLNEIAFDNLQGIIVARSYNLQNVMGEKLAEANRTLLRFEYRRNAISSISWMLNYIVKWMPHLVLGTIALFRVLDGKMTVGEMTYFILMLDRIVHPLSELPWHFNTVKTASVSKRRLTELMEQEEETDGKVTERKEEVPSVVFRKVKFGYEPEHPILKNVTFSVREGKKIAFVGESGAGKSTILKLICGFYAPESGSVMVYGSHVEKWNKNAMREQIALVSQNVYLFPASIAWNVACGDPSYSREQIEHACKMANIHEMIVALPKGYDTEVGERGDLFSGGEKQRISIARAFLKNAPILLLDEPTSAVDVGTENMIKEAIERISKGRTVITIAHRLSTVENVDKIYVLEKGKIEEAGTSEQLLKKQGIYYKLYEAQKKEGRA